jgi:hypothetical protein
MLQRCSITSTVRAHARRQSRLEAEGRFPPPPNRRAQFNYLI